MSRHDPDWKKRGTCTPADTRDAYGTEAQQRDFVRRCCTRCPVLAICNQHATTSDEAGAWGGQTEGDRARARTLARYR